MKTVLIISMTIFLATTQKPSGPPASDSRPVILGFGDSLTAGFGVPREGGYPDQLQRALDQRGYRYRVVNMGISGDTTSGGIARLRGGLDLKPSFVILELGANDGLRGLPIAPSTDVKRPPSEKESGVTLSTPMIQVRGPSTHEDPRRVSV